MANPDESAGATQSPTTDEADSAVEPNQVELKRFDTQADRQVIAGALDAGAQSSEGGRMFSRRACVVCGLLVAGVGVVVAVVLILNPQFFSDKYSYPPPAPPVPSLQEAPPSPA